MADIFISYESSDRPFARRLAASLEREGWSVWWDRKLQPGARFEETIHMELDTARCVIVLWSAKAVLSDWVRDEAGYAKKRGILIPAAIEANVRIPFGFGQVQTSPLHDWKDQPEHEGYADLCSTVAARLFGVSDQPDKTRPGKNPEGLEAKALFGHRKSLVATVVFVVLATGTLGWLYFFRDNAGPSQGGELKLPNPGNSAARMEFKQINPGKFWMGCMEPRDRECYEDEKPYHLVQITKAFEMGKYEVTQMNWQQVMGTNPSRFKGESRPVENVSWNDAQQFIEEMNARRDGYRYRLPTEAEWEYAARAASNEAMDSDLDAVAWYDGNSGLLTHLVGQKRPNAWGLFDMQGNVWEWVQDYYDRYAADTQTDPTGAASGKERVERGGSWYYKPRLLRVSNRGKDEPGDRFNGVGFRLVRERIP